jgi:hypothetical protein
MDERGETLAQRLRLGPLSDREATQLCRALLSAIAAAPVSHDAIRTDTILLEKGKPTLLSAGAGPGSSDEALYAVASVLYEALTGRPWVAGTDPASADWSGVPRRLRRVLLRAFSPAPERRWQDAAAFQRALWVPRPSHRIWPAVAVILLATAIIAAFVLCKPLGLCWERP